MTEELGMATGNKYSIVTLVFFTTYVVFQPPSTVIVRNIGPRLHLATITLAWGAVMIGMGFVRTWQQLAATRVILGILEVSWPTYKIEYSVRRLTIIRLGSSQAVFIC